MIDLLNSIVPISFRFIYQDDYVKLQTEVNYNQEW